MNLWGKVKAQLIELRDGLRADYRANQAEYARKHPPQYGEQWKPVDQRAELPPQEIYCFRCGSRNIDSTYSNTHDRCRDCGYCTRFEPSDFDLRPPVEYTPVGVVTAERRNGMANIVERHPYSGRELGARPASRKDMQARPMPVQSRF